ncbi:MAG: N-acetylmuramoyl-L-alanine amidase family protein [Bacteroidota bacterium]
MASRHSCVLFFLSFFLAVPLVVSFADQKKITLSFEKRTSQTVRGLDTLDITFVALNDFASALSLPYLRNDSTLKLEMRLNAHRMKVSANNPFIVITELATNSASVSQFPQSVILRDDAYYAPVPAFVQIFGRLSSTGVSYEASSSTIYVGEKPATPRFDITGVEVEPRLNGYLLTIQATRKLNDIEKWLKRPGGWLFITIPDATVDVAAVKNAKQFGAVREVLVFPSPTSVQLTFRVASDVVDADLTSDPESHNILVSLRTESEAEKVDLERRRQEMIRQNLERDRARWNLDVIVIDAGHGGKDPGTTGVGGTKEKDVALAIALKLGALIEKNMKGVKVVYTRTTDKFVELYRRTQIANEAGGKLFLSIHCNSTERKPSNANGFEIYLLRPGKEESALRIAERENSVIQLEENYQQRYKKLTEEEFIILTMAQSAFVKHSENFAEVTANTMASHLKIKNSGVKQAGFYVLVGASMPNVLVETGYLSNRNEEKILKSAAGQTKIAEALWKGVQEYKQMYEKALKEGNIGRSGE